LGAVLAVAGERRLDEDNIVDQGTVSREIRRISRELEDGVRVPDVAIRV
jgi:hypothetical protein